MKMMISENTGLESEKVTEKDSFWLSFLSLNKKDRQVSKMTDCP